MIIDKSKYINKEQDGVKLTFEDGTPARIPTFKHRYKYTDLYNEWKAIEENITEEYQTEA